MTEEAREEMRVYQRKWRKNNKEKVAQYNKSYWEKKAEESKKLKAEGK